MNNLKISLLAAAVCGAVAGAASAQSNVTVYGIADIALTHARSDAAPGRVGLDSGNWYGSRLGFRGSEDLGNGVSVNFQLENGFGLDDGTMKQGNRLFGRHAWVGLKGSFGTLRLGRSWMPTYSLLTDVIDPFEDGMSGASSGFFGRNIFSAIDVRMQNTVFYSLAGKGLKGDLAYGLGEAAGSSAPGRQLSGTLAYTSGPLTAVFGYHDVNDATATGSARLAMAGATYNFGPATLHLGIDRQKSDAAGATTANASDLLLGVTVPVGAGRILASYNRLDDKRSANVDSSMLALGYTHALSKRTTLYTSLSHVDTGGVNKFSAGIRHKF